MGLSPRLLRAAPVIVPDTAQRLVVPFGEWMPDLPDHRNPGAITVRNVIPGKASKRPFPAFANVATSGLNSRCIGATPASDAAGQVYVYMGTQTRLYSYASRTGAAPTNVTRATEYSTADDGTWRFAEFMLTDGSRIVVATNHDDEVQYITVGGAAFANLITGANTPRARDVAAVADFIVLLNTNDETDGGQPWRAWWSGIRDPSTFDPSATTQSGYQDIREGGWGQRIIGGREFGIVFMERAIWRMQYTADRRVFRFDQIEGARGTPIPNSVTNYGRLTFYIDESGFQVTDGFQSVPIGHNKVDRTFWDQFDLTYFSRVSTAIDPINKLWLILFPGTGHVGGDPNRLWVYNMLDKEWGEVQMTDVFWIFFSQRTGYTLDELDAISPNLDLLPFSLDSRAWTGGGLELAGVDSTHRYGRFTGASLAAVIDTSEIRPLNGQKFSSRFIRPLIDGSGTITAQVAGRDRGVDAASFGTAGSLTTSGKVPLRETSHYQRYRVSLAAGWSGHAQGVEVEFVPAGAR